MIRTAVFVLFCLAQPAYAQTRTPIDVFLNLTNKHQSVRADALGQVGKNWSNGDAPMLIESARFSPDRRTREAIVQVLREQTGQNLDTDLDKWYRWLWNQDIVPHPDYAEFKKTLYARIDPRFAEYFSNAYPTTIRLDEIRWGGVIRDGIPPLKNPQTISAVEATYLADSDTVFGVEFNGQARAYPKRILAWHEMVKDVVGGQSINGVYCTLCGSMIVYDTEFKGKHYELGTSGFLYRSNKLMYDHATESLWSTLSGKPVVGELVGKDIELTPLYVVTTTWGEWKQKHPTTDVLSLNTGHRRDYGEGVAYAAYFATDELMFTVPKPDSRLKNKDEVLIIRVEAEAPLAIAADLLRKQPVYHGNLGRVSFVILTDITGANRVYDIGEVRFTQQLDGEYCTSNSGVRYRITESALVPVDGSGSDSLLRLPAHRAFWFGWVAAFQNTTLVK